VGAGSETLAGRSDVNYSSHGIHRWKEMARRKVHEVYAPCGPAPGGKRGEETAASLLAPPLERRGGGKRKEKMAKIDPYLQEGGKNYGIHASYSPREKKTNGREKKKENRDINPGNFRNKKEEKEGGNLAPFSQNYPGNRGTQPPKGGGQLRLT